MDQELGFLNGSFTPETSSAAESGLNAVQAPMHFTSGNRKAVSGTELPVRSGQGSASTSHARA